MFSNNESCIARRRKQRMLLIARKLKRLPHHSNLWFTFIFIACIILMLCMLKLLTIHNTHFHYRASGMDRRYWFRLEQWVGVEQLFEQVSLKYMHNNTKDISITNCISWNLQWEFLVFVIGIDCLETRSSITIWSEESTTQPSAS